MSNTCDWCSLPKPCGCQPVQAAPQKEPIICMDRAVAQMILAALDEEAAAYDDPIAHVIEARDAMFTALAAPPQAAPHAAPLLPTQAALDSPRIDMPPSLSPEEKGAFMLGVAAGNVAAPHAVLVEARGALDALPDLLDAYWDAAYDEGKAGRTHDTKDGTAMRLRIEIDAAIASIERTLSQTQEPTPEIYAAFEAAYGEGQLDINRLRRALKAANAAALSQTQEPT